MPRCVSHGEPFSPFSGWLVLTVLLLGLEACAGVSSPPVLAPEFSRTPEDVLATLHAREAKIHSLKGLFQADIRGAYLPFSHRIHGTLFYERPDSIRVTGLTRTGGALFDFLVRGESYALRVPERRNVVVGRMVDLHRLGDVSLPIQLSLHAVNLLIGKAPWASRSPEMRVEGHAYRYTIPVVFRPATFPDRPQDPSDGLQHVWVDRSSAQIHTIEYRTVEEEPWLALSASDFQSVDDGHAGREISREHRHGSSEPANALMLPFVIHATDATTSESVELVFLELTANVPLSEQAFHVR